MRSLLAGSMICAALTGCGWPEFPLFLSCKNNWTSMISEEHGLPALYAVFATQDTVYAVGEHGQIVTILYGQPPISCKLENDDTLTALSVIGDKLIITGTKGIYELTSINPCQQASVLSITPNYLSLCRDISASGEFVIAACDVGFVFKRLSDLNWSVEAIQPARSVSLQDSTAIVTADERTYRRNLEIQASSLDISNTTNKSILLDSWSDKKDTTYFVGTNAYFASHNSDGWTNLNSTLLQKFPASNIVAVSGKGELGPIYLSGSYFNSINARKESVFCKKTDDALICDEPTGPQEYLSIYGTPFAAFRVGRGATKGAGFMDCQRH